MDITDGIKRIDGVTANSYFLEFNGNKILVDAGTPGGGKKIVKFFEEYNTKPEIVLITHYHPDHTGGLNLIYMKYHPVIYSPDKEIDIITGKTHPAVSAALPRLFSHILHTIPVQEIKPCSEMKIAGINYIDTPGHTEGSTSYFIEDLKILFSGDAAINKNGRMAISKMFSSNIKETERSLQKIREINANIILPGHGDPIKSL